MQIRKTYMNLKPELLYDEVRDFALKRGVVAGEASMETYSLPEDSSSFISRGTMTFNTMPGEGKAGKECLRVHIVGSARGELKLMLDVDETLFSQEKLTALQDDLDFVFSTYEK